MMVPGVRLSSSTAKPQGNAGNFRWGVLLSNLFFLQPRVARVGQGGWVKDGPPRCNSPQYKLHSLGAKGTRALSLSLLRQPPGKSFSSFLCSSRLAATDDEEQVIKADNVLHVVLKTCKTSRVVRIAIASTIRNRFFYNSNDFLNIFTII